MENITTPKFETFHIALSGLEPFPTKIGDLEVLLEVIRDIDGLRFCYSVKRPSGLWDTVFANAYRMDLIEPTNMRHTSGTSRCNSEPIFFTVVGAIYTHAAIVHNIFLETTA